MPFTANTSAYTQQHVALLARDMFAKLFPSIASQPRARREHSLQGLAAVAYELCTVPAQANSPEDDFKGCLDKWSSTIEPFCKEGGEGLELAPALAVMAAVCGLDPAEDLQAVKAAFFKLASEVWEPRVYADKFKQTPELNDLTDTPFLLQVSYLFLLFECCSCFAFPCSPRFFIQLPP